MLIERCPTSSLRWAGQVSTQILQPVQSSGATWIVIRMPGRCRSRHSVERTPSGAPASASGGKTFIRIAACGHTSAHLAQSMQIDSSQIGISRAIERFSNRAVPVGNVPSTGSALTGRRSPWPAIIAAVTRCTKSGAVSGTGARSRKSDVTSAGTSSARSPSSALSTAATFRATTASPRFP